MPKRDPLTFPYHQRIPRLENLKLAMTTNTKRPPVGVTQGGSSRRGGGAKVAATDGLFRPPKPKR